MSVSFAVAIEYTVLYNTVAQNSTEKENPV